MPAEPKNIKGMWEVRSIIASCIELYFFLCFFYSNYILRSVIIEETANILKVAAIVPFQSSQLITAGGLRGRGYSMDLRLYYKRVNYKGSFAYIFIYGRNGLIGAWYAILIDQLSDGLLYCLDSEQENEYIQ